MPYLTYSMLLYLPLHYNEINLVDDSGIEPLSRQGYCRLLSFTTVIAHIETHYGRVHSHTRNLASGHITSIGVLLYGVVNRIRTCLVIRFLQWVTLPPIAICPSD